MSDIIVIGNVKNSNVYCHTLERVIDLFTALQFLPTVNVLVAAITMVAIHIYIPKIIHPFVDVVPPELYMYLVIT